MCLQQLAAGQNAATLGARVPAIAGCTSAAAAPAQAVNETHDVDVACLRRPSLAVQLSPAAHNLLSQKLATGEAAADPATSQVRRWVDTPASTCPEPATDSLRPV